MSTTGSAGPKGAPEAVNDSPIVECGNRNRRTVQESLKRFCLSFKTSNFNKEK